MFNLIVAACEGMGIGQNGTLPWRLREEMKHFTRLTKATSDRQKMNAVVMGRKTWESIPAKNRPLAGRLNVILTRNVNFLPPDHPNVIICRSLQEALRALNDRKSELELFWLIGGEGLFKEAIAEKMCHRIYLTTIHKKFDCDTFFPEIDKNAFQEVNDENVPQGVQTEGDISYTHQVLEQVK